MEEVREKFMGGKKMKRYDALRHKASQTVTVRRDQQPQAFRAAEETH